MKGNAEDFYGHPGMKKHFNGYPVGEPTNERGNKWYQDEPVIHAK